MTPKATTVIDQQLAEFRTAFEPASRPMELQYRFLCFRQIAILPFPDLWIARSSRAMTGGGLRDLPLDDISQEQKKHTFRSSNHRTVELNSRSEPGSLKKTSAAGFRRNDERREARYLNMLSGWTAEQFRAMLINATRGSRFLTEGQMKAIIFLSYVKRLASIASQSLTHQTNLSQPVFAGTAKEGKKGTSDV